MLKIRQISDLHCEFNFDHTLIKRKDEDVLIVAGDVGVGRKQVVPVLEYFADEFPEVVYVFGNHEFYRQDFQQVKEKVKKDMEAHKNVHILDRDTVEIGGVTFVGATLWSSFNHRDPFVMQHCSRCISDFRVITCNGDMTPFGTSNAADEFYRDWGYIKVVVEQTKSPVVVVTHFLPDSACIDEQYRGEGAINYYFANDLGNDIADMENVKFWCMGHTHSIVDVTIGTTRCVASPYGYHGREVMARDSDHPRLNFTFEV